MKQTILLIGLLVLVVVLSGCIEQPMQQPQTVQRYTCPDGTIVSNPSLCPKSELMPEPEPDQCQSASDCDDYDDSTIDTCSGTPKKCSHAQIPECIPDWQCSDWSECSQSGKQTRICADNSACGVATGKPGESQSCTPQIIKPKSIGPFEIKIVGDSDCVAKTNQALDLLKNKATIHYDVVVKYVAVIECAESGSGMFAWEDPPRYKVGKATIDAGTIWYAGTVAHDACHSKQYHDYLLNNPSSSVPPEVYTGRNAEAQCLDVQYDALNKMGASQWSLDYVKNIINSEYWNVEYANRWW